jgi:4-hydroxy-tetrahydrodipicolinate reductase
MNIALIGYGKMGKAIEEIALQRGHQIVLKIDITNAHDFNPANLSKADVAIEFTGPESAVENIKKCIEAGVPVVSGSTGWLDKWEEVVQYCKEKNGGLLYASNFSIGVNIFFEANRQLAALMSDRTEYNVAIEEIHHTQKKDAPSGTSITLAEGILENLSAKNKWVLGDTANQNELSIISKRIDPAPGTHIITYDSPVDSIEIKHTAHSRTGFASGAVLAADFMIEKKGIYGMRDVLKII